MSARSLPRVRFEVLHTVEPGVISAACAGGFFTLDPRSGTVEVRDGDAVVRASWHVDPDALGGTRPDVTVEPHRQIVVVSEPARTTVLHAEGGGVSVAHARWDRNGGAALIDPGEADRPLLWEVAASAPVVACHRSRRPGCSG